MSCIKTACYAYVEPYGVWVYGDAHQFGDSYVFRLVTKSYVPMSSIRHFTIQAFGEWWDKEANVSTLISNSTEDHGYEGIEEQFTQVAQDG